ncbi:MAG: hypothetical protein KGL78_14330 [Burkholderiales bacterium]|nr:hypothetical protein [Burkholderiales bacterium]
MRAAPPVSVRADGGRGWRAVRAGLPALAAASGVTWALQWSELVDAGAADAVGLVVGAALAVLAWRHVARPAATLAWDGERWSVDDTPGRLDLMLDLPGWLLLRLRPAAGRPDRWVAVTAAEAGADETLLRAALQAHQGTGATATPPGTGPTDA